MIGAGGDSVFEDNPAEREEGSPDTAWIYKEALQLNTLGESYRSERQAVSELVDKTRHPGYLPSEEEIQKLDAAVDKFITKL